MEPGGSLLMSTYIISTLQHYWAISIICIGFGHPVTYSIRRTCDQLHDHGLERHHGLRTGVVYRGTFMGRSSMQSGLTIPCAPCLRFKQIVVSQLLRQQPVLHGLLRDQAQIAQNGRPE